MNFASPGLLWLLLLVPAVVAAYVVTQRRRNKYAVRFSNLDLLAGVVTASPRWRKHVPAVLSILALVALIGALARPQVSERVPKQETAVILTLDRSGSMRAEDVDPTRLVAAQRAATRFIDELPDQTRIAVIGFSSSVDVLVAPGTDHDGAREAVNSLVADGGTAMGDGLSRALDLAATQLAPPEQRGDEDEPAVAIILLSDGANTVGINEPLAVASEAARIGVPVFTIALGTDEGTVEIPGPTGPRLLPVPPDRPTLQQIAETTRARAFDAPSEADLNSIYDTLGTRIAFEVEQRERTAVAAAIAAGLLLAAIALSMAWFGRVI